MIRSIKSWPALGWMLAVAFAAVMLVAGQSFIEYRANKYPANKYPIVQTVKTAYMPL